MATIQGITAPKSLYSMKTITAFLTCALLALACACGGGSMGANAKAATGPTVDFINNSSEKVSTSQLQQWWSEAQTADIDLNYAARLLNPSLVQDLRPADPRALAISPKNVDFRLMPTTTPGGGFDCSPYNPNLGISLCYGLTLYRAQGDLIMVSDGSDLHIHLTAVYEMQNSILHTLGYDVRGR